MNNPPKEIDGAKVIEWTWSGNKPFGVIRYATGKVAAEIYGLALCQYPKSEAVYRFSCNSNWESEQDANYSSIEEAKHKLPEQYRNQQVKWQKYKCPHNK